MIIVKEYSHRLLFRLFISFFIVKSPYCICVSLLLGVLIILVFVSHSYIRGTISLYLLCTFDQYQNPKFVLSLRIIQQSASSYDGGRPADEDADDGCIFR